VAVEVEVQSVGIMAGQLQVQVQVRPFMPEEQAQAVTAVIWLLQALEREE
jgi:hypothetical protein